jgi:hypothetical protein
MRYYAEYYTLTGSHGLVSLVTEVGSIDTAEQEVISRYGNLPGFQFIRVVELDGNGKILSWVGLLPLSVYVERLLNQGRSGN